MLEELRTKVTAAMEMLKKNRSAIAVNGRIPQKYAKAYNKKVDEMYVLLDEYVFRTVTGDWWLGDNDQEKQAFTEAYKNLITANSETIGQAISKMDLQRLDKILKPLNKSFEENMLDLHIETMKRKCQQYC